MSDRRVVVTGLGAVTPAGNTVAETWASLTAGRSAIDRITQLDPSDLPVQIAGEVTGFDPASLGILTAAETRRMARCTQLAVVAAEEAIAQADLRVGQKGARRAGVVLGSAGGGLELVVQQQALYQERGARRVSPFALPNFLPDASTAYIAIRHGLKGPNHGVTAACATGAHATGEAYWTVRRGSADVMITGGTEAGLLPLVLAGFATMRVLAQHEDPKRASRPFDRDRNGFVFSEGAAVLVLEELQHALDRGAQPLAELVGFGNGNDAFDIAGQADGGAGAVQVMEDALELAGLAPSDVDYINAHGTGTQMNDRLETAAIKTVFGELAYGTPVSSIKSMIGHPMGAAGAIEALASVMTIREGCIPPTINYETPDPECDLDYVPNTARQAQVDVAMSNSLGLGGHNSSLIFRRYEG